MGAHELAIDAGHAAARERALRGVRNALHANSDHAGTSDGVIPVDARGWEAVLFDAGVAPAAVAFVDALVAARALDVNDPQVIGGQLRRALLNAVALHDQLLRRVEQASWFIPPTGRERDRKALERIAAVAPVAIRDLIDNLTTASRATGRECWRDSGDGLSAFAAALADRPGVDDADDAVELVFGAPAERFRDRRGLIDSARIRAFFADRPDELERISRRLLTSLIDADTLPPDAAVYAASFTLSERPLICHEVARETLGEISSRFAADPDATASALARRFRGVRDSASTHFDGLVPTAARLHHAAKDGESARLAVDLYRLAAEGPLRQTGWAYLELRGHPARDTPTLAEVRDLLVADGTPLALLIADGIHTEWRNPSAHEEYHWDAMQKRIITASGPVTRAEVEAATGYAMSVMHGFETGLACARQRIPDLARRLESEAAVHEPPLVDMRVRSAFARQALWVWDTEWRGDDVEVIVDDDLDRHLHSVLAGILAAAFEAPPQTRWRIHESNSERAIEVAPEAVAASREVLGAPHWGPLDVNVLVPLLAAAKTAAGEPVGEVARDVTRLTLKHPLGIAQDEAQAIVRQQGDAVDRLIDALDVAERALAATWALLEGDGHQRHVLEHLRKAHQAAAAWRRGERARFISLEHHLNALFDAYHALPHRPLRVPVASIA